MNKYLKYKKKYLSQKTIYETTDHNLLIQSINIDDEEILILSINFSQREQFIVITDGLKQPELTPLFRNKENLQIKSDKELQTFVQSFMEKAKKYKESKKAEILTALQTSGDLTPFKNEVKDIIFKKTIFVNFIRWLNKRPLNKNINKLFLDKNKYNVTFSIKNPTAINPNYEVYVNFSIILEDEEKYKKRSYSFLKTLNSWCNGKKCILALQEINPVQSFIEVLNLFPNIKLVDTFSEFTKSKTILLSINNTWNIVKDNTDRSVLSYFNKSGKDDPDRNTKYILTTTNQTILTIYNIHGQTSAVDKLEYDKQYLWEHLISYVKNNSIILGDFNTFNNPSKIFNKYFNYIMIDTPEVNFYSPKTTKDFIIMTPDIKFNTTYDNFMQNQCPLVQKFNPNFAFPEKVDIQNYGFFLTNFKRNTLK